jgi:hypothetical protein
LSVSFCFPFPELTRQLVSGPVERRMEGFGLALGVHVRTANGEVCLHDETVRWLGRLVMHQDEMSSKYLGVVLQRCHHSRSVRMDTGGEA